MSTSRFPASVSRYLNCLLAGTVCVTGALPGCATTSEHHPVYCPDQFTEAARHSLNRNLEMQTANGQMLDHTIWNYHFYEDSEELRPSGRAFLDRMARRSPMQCSGYYVQTAHDLVFKGDDADAYFQRRQELDALRMKSAAEYLQRVSPGNTLVAQVHDHPPVALPSDESGRAFILMSRKAPQGLLPPEVTASQFSFGAGGSGDFGMSVGGGFGGFGDSGALPPALGGAMTGDPGLPDFGSDVPTMPGGEDFSVPPPP